MANSTLSNIGTALPKAIAQPTCLVGANLHHRLYRFAGSRAVIWKNALLPEIMRAPQQEVVLTQAEIQAGQETYLARGGQHIGSIWGHGSYLAPDWTADVLHRWGLATAGVVQQSACFFPSRFRGSTSPRTSQFRSKS